MSRRTLWNRITKMEGAIRDNTPPAPWVVMVPHFLSGSPEALEQEAAFELAHPGRDLVLIQMVSGRLPVTA